MIWWTPPAHGSNLLYSTVFLIATSAGFSELSLVGTPYAGALPKSNLQEPSVAAAGKP